MVEKSSKKNELNMGWASGSEVARKMIEVIFKNISDKKLKKKLYKVLIDSLTEQDWDTIDEAMGIDEDFDKIAEKYFE